MNPEINKLRTLADNMGAKLLPVMENLTKEKVAVKVTDNNRKHIAKTLKMFGVLYTPEMVDCTFLFFNKNVLMGCYYHKKDKTLISHKQLRTILAKEYLKEGDYVIATIGKTEYVVKVESIWNNEAFINSYEYLCINDGFKHNVQKHGSFTGFKRYATTEEIALLEPKPKDLEVGKWYLFIGHTVEYKPLMLITKNNGSDVKFCGFNFIGNWVDNDLYTLEDLKRHGYREATPQEVESALTNEAIKRVHKYEKFEYNLEENTLCGYNGRLEEVFVNGKWNEPFDKFAELKEAHKNGAVIQVKGKHTGIWHDNDCPSWSESHEYRIKPSFEELPKPNVLVWAKRKDGVYLAKRNGNPRSKNQDPSKNCDWNGIRFDEIKNPSDHNSGVHFPCNFSDITVEEWRYIEQPKWNEDAEYRIKPEEKPKVGDVVRGDYGDDFVIKILRPSELNSPLFKYTKLTQQEAIDLLFGKETYDA